jgi:hypothetical protein
MSSSSKDQDRSLHDTIESRRADAGKPGEDWARDTRRKDVDILADRDSDLPTHVVGEHHTD